MLAPQKKVSEHGTLLIDIHAEAFRGEARMSVTHFERHPYRLDLVTGMERQTDG